MTPENPFSVLEDHVRKQAAEEQAATALASARCRLIVRKDAGSAFFATLALRLVPEVSWECETCMTDGKRLVYNPDFIRKLSPEHLLGVVGHEVMHNACNHHSRRGHRELKLWNIGADCSINPLLIQAGFSLPPQALMPGRGEYAHLPEGKSVEEYYALLQKPGKDEDGEGEGQGDGEDDGEGKGKGQDPGGCGGVQDPGEGSQAECRQSEAEWEVAVAQAHQVAKQRGTLPAGIERLVQQVLAPRVDWREVLREYISRHAKNDYCVAPETLVLKSDLTWVPAGALVPGDKLVGVDELLAPKQYHRRICETMVELVNTFDAPRFRINTDVGLSVVATPGHQFLLCPDGAKGRWEETWNLKKGSKIKFIGAPWTEDRSDSWMAGIFDGEGFLTINTPDKVRASMNLGIVQNAGPVLDRVKKVLADFRLTSFRKPKVATPGDNSYRKSNCYSLTVGSIADVFRLIGTYRPTRLLPKLQKAIRGRYFSLPRPGKAVVTSIEEVSPGPVVAIRTTSRTLITNGIISHNSWAHPNRRFIHQGIYLPGMRSEELGDVIVAVDTSGSIGGAVLDRFASELQGILDGFDVSLTILYHDAAICHTQQWKSSDGPLVLEPKGGGGTSHVPVFEWVEEHGEPPACMVCLTDMASQFPDRAPEYPVLWAAVGSYGAKAPFGQMVEVE